MANSWGLAVTTGGIPPSTLSPEELENAVIFGAGYGHVAPPAYLGRDGGLPPTYSGHNSYHLWGPPPDSVEVAVFLGFSEEGPDGRLVPDPRLEELFADVELAHLHRCDWCMSWRDDMPIWIARDPKRPFSELWTELRRFL